MSRPALLDAKTDALLGEAQAAVESARDLDSRLELLCPNAEDSVIHNRAFKMAEDDAERIWKGALALLGAGRGSLEECISLSAMQWRRLHEACLRQARAVVTARPSRDDRS